MTISKVGLSEIHVFWCLTSGCKGQKFPWVSDTSVKEITCPHCRHEVKGQHYIKAGG